MGVAGEVEGNDVELDAFGLHVVGQLARPVVEVVLDRDGGAGGVLDLDRAMVRSRR